MLKYIQFDNIDELQLLGRSFWIPIQSDPNLHYIKNRISCMYIYDIDGVILDTLSSARSFYGEIKEGDVDYYDSSAVSQILQYLKVVHHHSGHCERIIECNVEFISRTKIDAFVTSRDSSHIGYLLRHPNRKVAELLNSAPLICTGGDKFSVLKQLAEHGSYYFDDNYNNCMSAKVCGLNAVHIRAPGVSPLRSYENGVDSYDSLPEFYDDVSS